MKWLCDIITQRLMNIIHDDRQLTVDLVKNKL